MKPSLWVGALAVLTACEQAPPPSQEQVSQAREAAPSRTANTVPPAPAAPASVPAAQRKNVVDCTDQEETIFSCEMPGGKYLAVCAPKNGQAEYRFGGDTAELTLTGGEWANTAYSGGGEAQIFFSNGGTDYIVFSRMVRTNFAADEPNYPAISDGVVIMRGDEYVATRLCAGGQAEMPVQYDAAKRAFGETRDIFTGATERTDPR